MAQVKLFQNNDKFLELNCNQSFTANLENGSFNYVSYNENDKKFITLFSSRKNKQNGINCNYYLINVDLILNYGEEILNLIKAKINEDINNSKNIIILLFSPIYDSKNKLIQDVFMDLKETFKEKEQVIIHSSMPRLNTLNKNNIKTLCSIIDNDFLQYSNLENLEKIKIKSKKANL